MHLAASDGWYSDYELAVAAHNIPEYAALFPMAARYNVFDANYVQEKDHKVLGSGRLRTKMMVVIARMYTV
jgi:hypothetical protein